MIVSTGLRFRAYVAACTFLMCLAGMQANGQPQHGDEPATGHGNAKPTTPTTKTSTTGESAKTATTPKFGTAKSATGTTASESSTTKKTTTKENKGEPTDGTSDAEASLAKLKEGNSRWVDGSETNPNTDSARRTETVTNGQHPYAIVLTCADSRVPIERVFDCGVGDVFGLRVAGNVVDAELAGSIEYAVEHMHVPVIVVMGHTGCGAVAAAASGGEVTGNLKTLVEHIEPAVERAHSCNPSLEGKELASAAVKENVWQSVFDLLNSSEPCRDAVKTGQVKIVGAVYDIGSGKVEWMGEHPWQKQLVTAMESEQADSSNETQTASEHGDH